MLPRSASGCSPSLTGVRKGPVGDEAEIKGPDGQVAQTACARALIRGGVNERTGEALAVEDLASSIGWCTALVSGIAAGLLASHWNVQDMDAVASGTDPAGRPLPTSAWMALRRLGWAGRALDGITVNDRIVRMAQEQAGRALRSACWRAELTNAVLATGPQSH